MADALGIAEPSPQLSEGIYCIVRAVRAAAPPGGVPTLNALLIAAREDRPGEQALDGLARRCSDQRSNNSAPDMGSKSDDYARPIEPPKRNSKPESAQTPSR